MSDQGYAERFWRSFGTGITEPLTAHEPFKFRYG